MSMFRIGGARRGRPSRLDKLIAELYRQGKCRECSVTVTRMNFAKILGKFTKVKIQYEGGPAEGKIAEEKPVEKNITSPNTNARLRSNENGMVLIHRTAYKAHPAKEALGGAGRTALRKLTSPVQEVVKRPRGRPPKNKHLLAVKSVTRTQYRIIFYDKRTTDNNLGTAEATIVDIMPGLSTDILPTDEWLVEYLPRQGEPKEDLVYDRIAAELEDLMNDSKPEKNEVKDDFPSIMDLLKDALEDPEQKEADKPVETSSESCTGSGDVEAILRGDTDESTPNVSISKDVEDSIEQKETGNPSTADTSKVNAEASKVNAETAKVNAETSKVNVETFLENDSTGAESIPSNTECSNLTSTTDEKKSEGTEELVETVDSVAIESKKPLDADIGTTLPNVSLNDNEEKDLPADTENSEKMEVDEVPPIENISNEDKNEISSLKNEQTPIEIDEQTVLTNSVDETREEVQESKVEELPKVNGKSKPLLTDQNINIESINYIIFKRVKNEECNRLVKCSKNLDYSIEMDGRPVELLGAPKYLSSVEDLRLMLQIVHESDLNSFNVVHE